MTGFWIAAALAVALALAFVLTPLLRWRRARSAAPRAEANASIYREQIAELEAELARGAITQEEFGRASVEIERRIVAEHSESREKFSRVNPGVAALIVGLAIPVFAGVTYWKLGELRALDPKASHEISPQQVEAMVERLSARLEQTPEDAEGWALLGRSLFVLGRHEQALRAFARALQLTPEDRELLGTFMQSLALAGQDRFEKADYAGAIGYWERILRFAPPDSELAKVVGSSIGEARKLGGSGPAVARGPAAGPESPGAAKSAPARKDAPVAAAGSTTVQGTVTLDARIKTMAAPADTVFIFARPASGSRMPLAIARTTVSRLPYRFTLDDSMAMAPGATISSQQSLVVAARVSKSGNAAPQKGDLEGTSAPVAPGATGIAVVISRVVE